MGCTSKLVACAKWRGNATILLGASIQLITHFDGGSLCFWLNKLKPLEVPALEISHAPAQTKGHFLLNSRIWPIWLLYKHLLYWSKHIYLQACEHHSRSGNNFQHSTQHRWEFKPYYPPQPQEDLTEGKNERWIKASVKLSYFHSPEKGLTGMYLLFCFKLIMLGWFGNSLQTQNLGAKSCCLLAHLLNVFC